MAKVTLSLSTHTDSRGLSELYLRVSAGVGFQPRIRSGVFIPAKCWDAVKKSIIVPRLASKEQREVVRAKKHLDEMEALLLEAATTTPRERLSKALFEKIVKEYHHPTGDVGIHEDYSLADACEQYVVARKLGEWRRKAFRVLAGHLRRFEAECGVAVTLGAFNEAMAAEFEAFLTGEHRDGVHPRRGRNTIAGAMTKLRTVVLWANNEGYTTTNAFKRYKIMPEIYGRPYYITIEERNAIYEADLSDVPQLAVQRDIFVFQCLIGCRRGDLERLTKDSIVEGAVEYVPRKTKEGRPVVVRVPLNATAREIVERYADSEGEALLPFVVEQYYNRAIKDIFTRAGITRRVTVINPTTGEEERRPLNEIASSHLARRTFIGNLYKKVKDPNLIGALSGHKEGSKAFVRYRDIDEDMRRELVDMLE